MHPSPRDLICRDDVDRIILWAVDNEEIYLAGVAAPPGTLGVRLDALSAALDNAFTKTSRLALRSEESAVAVENQVIALIDTKRQQNTIAALN